MFGEIQFEKECRTRWSGAGSTHTTSCQIQTQHGSKTLPSGVASCSSLRIPQATRLARHNMFPSTLFEMVLLTSFSTRCLQPFSSSSSVLFSSRMVSVPRNVAFLSSGCSVLPCSEVCSVQRSTPFSGHTNSSAMSQKAPCSVSGCLRQPCSILSHLSHMSPSSFAYSPSTL